MMQKYIYSIIVFGVLTCEAMFWAADWVFFSYLTLTGGLCRIGLSSHRQICLNLLLNNSVDLFYCWTIPQRVREPGEQPFSLTYILFPLLFTYFFFNCTFFFIQKTLSLSFSNLQFFLSRPPLLSTPSAAAKVRFLTSLQKKQSAPKSLHFYSYKYRFRAHRSPPDTKPEWPFDWQLSPFHPNTNEIHKHTSNWLESPAQHQR